MSSRWTALASFFLVVCTLGIVGVFSSAGSGSAGTPAPQALSVPGVGRSWGGDTFGQLGNDETEGTRSAPVPVAGLTSIAQISASQYHTLALLSNGDVWSWGYDGQGQLGNDNVIASENQRTPAPATLPGGAPLTGVKAVSAGEFHSLALMDGGSMMAWGNDISGQLGDGGSNTDQPQPVPVSDITDAVAISAGDGHSLALLTNGEVRAWGDDLFGQLGNSSAFDDDEDTPVAVVLADNTTPLTGVKAIAGGSEHSLALLNNGRVHAWGADTGGELGNSVPFNDNQANPGAGGEGQRRSPQRRRRDRRRHEKLPRPHGRRHRQVVGKRHNGRRRQRR
ncbi:MAG: hypothetical protein WEB00_04355 [Dehalococcoidia bacterium]